MNFLSIPSVKHWVPWPTVLVLRRTCMECANWLMESPRPAVDDENLSQPRSFKAVLLQMRFSSLFHLDQGLSALSTNPKMFNKAFWRQGRMEVPSPASKNPRVICRPLCVDFITDPTSVKQSSPGLLQGGVPPTLVEISWSDFLMGDGKCYERPILAILHWKHQHTFHRFKFYIKNKLTAMSSMKLLRSPNSNASNMSPLRKRLTTHPPTAEKQWGGTPPPQLGVPRRNKWR